MYDLEITEIASKKFIKKLQKKHKKHWFSTIDGLTELIKRIRPDQFAKLRENGDHKLIKVYFKIHKTKTSKKGSGCRCIVHLAEKNKMAKILLVYSKNDIGPPNETVKIMEFIKNYHSDIAAIFNL